VADAGRRRKCEGLDHSFKNAYHAKSDLILLLGRNRPRVHDIRIGAVTEKVYQLLLNEKHFFQYSGSF